MAELLVTGGAGFIGSNFVRYWRERYPSDGIVVLDSLSYAGDRANLDGLAAIEFVQGDIRDFELARTLLERHRIDTLVHFAAESHVDRSIHGPDAFIETNVVGTHTLLKAAKAVWLEAGRGRAHRFHHVSTDEVFGSLGPDDPPFCETTPYAPNSPYSASKAGSDHLVRAYHRTFGLNVTTTNCPNNYGPRQFPEKLIPLCLINALLGKTLPVYGDGGNVREWLHVEDHCRGIELVLKKGRIGECYNVGGGEETSNLELLERLCACIDAAFARAPELARRFPDSPAATRQPTRSLIRFVKDRPGHDRRYSINATRITSELAFAASHGLTEGLESTVAWYLANEPWWRH